ncbi:ABC transporter family substrate-binding protein [Streptomyces benahoarensis]|uniref:ABC transporter family substrate-binding protein n=1 Tax=Streptomyces benahoarensis TaxID=2595054 RepID=A0A553ZCQ5_9ACTN|nr:ABC transporter family substrate-binding protein [Streptomyces benahoarensis]TSB21150.1 ABC transporter family substrate-binding protein [Streptomyces benahoarensis]TSB39199.1 ABC transporter family substrate-binding protein [Streptomyces benahoarensis]
MTDHVSPGRAVRRRRRAVLLAAGVLLPLPVLAGCADDDGGGASGLAQDIAAAPRGRVANGGTVRWAVDALPSTLNAFHTDADAATYRVTGAVLPSLFTLDRSGTPQRNADYLTAADLTTREPRQVVVYKLNPKARWSDGRPIGAADFVAQWKALRGTDHAYWTARNSGYDRIAKVEQGAGPHEVKVTFAKPYADWRALFTPLYPQSVMVGADAFNDGARDRLPVTAGPFAVGDRNSDDGTLTLERDRHWWGAPAKLDRLELRAVPRGKRADALSSGDVDVAEVDAAVAKKIDDVGGAAPAGVPKSVHAGNTGAQPGAGQDAADQEPAPRGAVAADAVRAQAAARGSEAARAEARAAAVARTLRGYAVRRALQPAYTQLALNGGSGPLSDDRVRRAVARAIDRQALADTVLKPLRLPATPLGSHLLLSGQEGYADHSDAVGGTDTDAAKTLLADAGWRTGRSTPGSPQPAQGDAQAGHGGAPGDTAAGGRERAGEQIAAQAPAVKKDGKPLTLRFVVPDGPASAELRTVSHRIATMLSRIGIATAVQKVADDSYLQDHIEAGDYDLALYSWPGTAYPSTDARPVYAKPQPAPDGSLSVGQNYTRVGSDRVDQLFDQAVSDLDPKAAREALNKADARIWASAGSIPLYQRPELVATKKSLVNIGSFGFAAPRFQDIGYAK